jgi:predicted transcriptional regulator
MGSRKSIQPTNAELQILQILWKRGPSTVSQVLREMGEVAGYTTVLKLLQIMHEKGIVARDEAFRPHVYRAREPEAKTQKGLLSELARKAFGGSAAKMILQAISTQTLSGEELAEIRKLVREAGMKKN